MLSCTSWISPSTGGILAEAEDGMLEERAKFCVGKEKVANNIFVLSTMEGTSRNKSEQTKLN